MEVLKKKQIMTNPLGDRDTIRGYLTLVIRGKGGSGKMVCLWMESRG